MLNVPFDGVPFMPPPEPRPRSILDAPQWAWVEAAREAQAYSTFEPGQEPDVWPSFHERNCSPSVLLGLLLGCSILFICHNRSLG